MADKKSPSVELAVDEQTYVTGSEVEAQRSAYVKMRDHLAKQPKVRVRLNEDTLVQLNGWTVNIKGGEPVMVPQQIAQVLEDSGRI